MSFARLPISESDEVRRLFPIGPRTGGALVLPFSD